MRGSEYFVHEAFQLFFRLAPVQETALCRLAPIGTANLVRQSAVAVDDRAVLLGPSRPSRTVEPDWLGAARLHQTAGCANSKRANRGRPVQNLHNLRMRPRQNTQSPSDRRREADSVASRWGRYRGPRFADGRDPIGVRFRFILVRFVNKFSCHMYFPSISRLSPRHPQPPPLSSAAGASNCVSLCAALCPESRFLGISAPARPESAKSQSAR